MKHTSASNTENRVAAHHQAAAGVWSLGGEAYNDISFGLSDALAHAAQRLAPKPGDEVLDVATGTGWTARNIARVGARVTAIDIAAELLTAAQVLSAHVRPAITFELADAERLPFPDKRFDGVISTFGVMFAQNQQQAAAELGRVCRTGGRLALATWAPRGAVAEVLAIIGRYSDAPPPSVSPLAWGDPDQVTSLLGRDFELTFETGINNAYHPDTREIWERYAIGFGPMRRLVESLDPSRLEAFRRDIDAYHAHYAVAAGLHVKREYLVTIGRRR